MTALRRVTLNMGLVFGSSLVSLAILEIGLRIFNPIEVRVRGNEIVLPANIAYTIENDFSPKLDERIIHTKNSLGFRGPDLPSDFDQYLSIIAIGGSTTESMLISDERTWVHLLGVELERVFSPVWINNAGLDGHSTFGHTTLFSEFVVPLKPKVALFYVGINDVGTTAPRFYDKKTGTGVATDSLELLVITLVNRSEVLTLLLNAWRYVKARRGNLIHATRMDLSALATDRFHVTPEQQSQELQTHATSYVPAFGERVAQLVDLANEHGILPVLVTQPVLYGAVTDQITGVNLGEFRVGERMNGALGWEVLELYNDETRRIGAERGAPVIDLAREFPKRSDFFYDLIHYTNDGSRALADLVFRDLCPYLRARFESYATASCTGG